MQFNIVALLLSLSLVGQVIAAPQEEGANLFEKRETCIKCPNGSSCCGRAPYCTKVYGCNVGRKRDNEAEAVGLKKRETCIKCADGLGCCGPVPSCYVKTYKCNIG